MIWRIIVDATQYAGDRLLDPRTFIKDIRRLYNNPDKGRRKNQYRTLWIIVGVCLALGVALDLFTPFKHVFMVLRSIVAIVMAVPMFMLTYSFSLWLHQRNLAAATPEKPYKELRFRSQFTLRRRLSLLAIGSTACIVFAALALQRGGAYTFVFSVVMVIIYGLIVFARKTSEEAKNVALGVGANPREDSLQKTIDRGIRDREIRKERAQQKDKVKKVRNQRGKKAAEELQREYDKYNAVVDEELTLDPDRAFEQVAKDVNASKEAPTHS
jgi:hypothetical protein